MSATRLPVIGERRALAGLLVAWLLCQIAESTPHLVHHLFDADPAPECEYLAIAEHAPAAVASLGIGPVALLACGQPHPVAGPRVAASRLGAPVSRAPPSTPLAHG